MWSGRYGGLQRESFRSQGGFRKGSWVDCILFLCKNCLRCTKFVKVCWTCFSFFSGSLTIICWWGALSCSTPSSVEPSNVSDTQNNFDENIERVFGLVSILFGLQKWLTVTLSVYNTVPYSDLSSDPQLSYNSEIRIFVRPKKSFWFKSNDRTKFWFRTCNVLFLTKYTIVILM